VGKENITGRLHMNAQCVPSLVCGFYILHSSVFLYTNHTTFFSLYTDLGMTLSGGRAQVLQVVKVADHISDSVAGEYAPVICQFKAVNIRFVCPSPWPCNN
jgi:hypothetical protein